MTRLSMLRGCALACLTTCSLGSCAPYIPSALAQFAVSDELLQYDDLYNQSKTPDMHIGYSYYQDQSSVASLSPMEANVCARTIGVSEAYLHTFGLDNFGSTQIHGESGAAIKVEASQIRITVSAISESSFKSLTGLCIFLEGAQPYINLLVDEDISIGTLVIVTRGERPKVDIEVRAGAMIDDIAIDHGGKDSLVAVFGEGNYWCGDAISAQTAHSARSFCSSEL